MSSHESYSVPSESTEELQAKTYIKRVELLNIGSELGIKKGDTERLWRRLPYIDDPYPRYPEKFRVIDSRHGLDLDKFYILHDNDWLRRIPNLGERTLSVASRIIAHLRSLEQNNTE